MNFRPSLRRVVKNETGQDVYACRGCFDCEIPLANEMDVPLGSLIQMVLQDDEEALECRTLWSDAVMEAARGSCKRGLDLYAIMRALREESALRKSGLCAPLRWERNAPRG